MRFCTGRRLALLVACVCSCISWSQRIVAAEAKGGHPALSPQESRKQIVVDPGLKVELVAYEPNVIDPVAIRFDEDGRLWVVEMRDYPTGPNKTFSARSRISILKDKNGDGFFETATVFADNLSFATGLQPWQGGVFVTMAGQVAYMKDTNGDDKADAVEKWYTGFSQLNQQLRANHPRLALDNHIYISAGLRGGNIVDAKNPSVKPVSISGRDFRFDPITREFEAVTGEAQFGLSFDDYGNRFVCANRDPTIHMVLEDRQLKKNPLVTVDTVLEHVVYGDSKTPIFPIGRAWTTSNLHAGQFTAACGVEIYRGDALPDEYYGNIFVCEPTGYLVHRDILKPSGVTFTGQTAREGAEFFASRDEWCRPVNLEVGPDGALYVVDMYREIIEHPEWMPEELRHRPNLRAGNDRGRIYRVVRKDFRHPAAPKMSAMSGQALVKTLARPNAWWRETAARLLLERQDKTIAPQLRQMALQHDSPVARIQALRLLEGLHFVDDNLLMRLCDDPNPRIIEQAVIAADSYISKSNKLRERISQLVDSDDARVRFAALLTATPLPTAPKFPIDHWELDAMRIATGNRGGTVLANMLQHPDALQANVADPKLFIAQLARLAAASKDDEQRATAIEALVDSAEYGRVGLAGLLAEATRGGESLDEILKPLGDATHRRLDEAFASARADAPDANAAESVRCEAVDLLAFTSDATNVLLPLALVDPAQGVRLRGISGLARNQDIEPWKQLLAGFSKDTPALQRAILDGLFSSVKRTTLLLDEIAAGQIKPTVLDPVRTKFLLNHKDDVIKDRAAELLAASVPADREKVLDEYRSVLTMKADPTRGRAVFEKRCSVCHRIGDVGVQLAPDISDSREKSFEQILTDIIQPNRAIDSNYFSYTAITMDGRVHTGLLAAETSTSVTLKQQEGKSETLRRDEIDELHSDGVSFMPDGLEKDIPLQDMADLLSFIKNWRYLDNPQLPAAKP